MYDETNHWEECKICGEKLNQKEHIYKSSWTMGNQNICNEENVNKFICTCGYSYESIVGRKNHTMETTFNQSAYWWRYRCSVCYYTEVGHDCKLSDGSRINCLNLGICAMCGTDYRKYQLHHYNYSRKTNEYEIGEKMYCNKKCSEYIGIVNKCDLVKISETQYELRSNITVPDGAKFSHIINDNCLGTNVEISNSNIYTSGTTWSCITTLVPKQLSLII
jgi:hypothetical protein